MNKIGKLLISLLAAALMIATVYSVTVVTWNAVTTVTVDAATFMKVYWDEACTDPVTSIDFGNIQQGQWSEFKYLWIKNEGNQGYYVTWTSNISEASPKIFNYWQALDGTTWQDIIRQQAPPLWVFLDPNESVSTRYFIFANLDTPVQSYSWVLSVGAATSDTG